MVMRKKLAWHVIKNTGLAMLGAILLLTLLQILFGYLAELGKLSEKYTALQALQYILWDSPRKILQLLPISALIGAVVGLGAMASNSELVVMRSVGISLWRIVAWVCVPAVLLIFLSFTLSQWVIPMTSERAKMTQNHGVKTTLGEVRGYWTKENNRFFYIDYANAKGNLNHVQVLDFDENYRLNKILSAKQGQFSEQGQWQLYNTTQVQIFTDGHAEKILKNDEKLALALQPEFVHMVTVDPEELAPSQLISFMQYLQKYSQIPKKYELVFWKQVAAPLNLIALVIIACSFIFGPLRQQSMGFRLVIALFTGLGFYYLQDFLGYASLIYSISSAWFVFSPIMILFIIGTYLLNRMK